MGKTHPRDYSANQASDPAPLPEFLLNKEKLAKLIAQREENDNAIDWTWIRKQLKKSLSFRDPSAHAGDRIWPSFAKEVARIHGFSNEQLGQLYEKEPVRGFANAVTKYFGIQEGSPIDDALREAEMVGLHALKREFDPTPRMLEAEALTPHATLHAATASRAARLRANDFHAEPIQPSQDTRNLYRFIRRASVNIRGERG